MTFEQAAEEYHNAHKTEWRSAKHVTKWKALIENHVNPVMGKVPVADVDQALLLQVLRPIWLTKTATARRIRGQIAQVLSWSATDPRYYRLTGPNPAAWYDNREHTLPSPASSRNESTARHYHGKKPESSWPHSVRTLLSPLAP